MDNEEKKVWGFFYRGAGGRFAEDPAEEMILMRDETIPLKGIHLFDKAHIVMLVEENIIRKEDGGALLKALIEMEKEGYEVCRKRVGGGGHSGEAYLIDKLGMDLGGQVHLGRSSADLIGVTIRIEERDRILDLLDGLIKLSRQFLDLSESHLNSIMPAYTHFQQAQPITFAHYLLSWVFAIERDFERLEATYSRTNKSPAGSAIVSGSPFPINRERVSELLGFDMVIPNTRDAIFGFDHHLELFACLSILNHGLARFCSDLYIWSSSEFDFIELKDRYCGTSSINPCKKNPQALEQIFSLAAQTTGRMITAFSVDRMPSESWEIQWRVWSQELWPLLRKTIQAIVLINHLIESMEVKTKSMAEMARSGWITSSDLAAIIVKERGLPWRIAHQTVAHLVRLCIDRGIPSHKLTPELLDEVSEDRIGKKLALSQSDIKKAVDPFECIRERRLTGGPAPEQVAKQIEACRKGIKAREGMIIEMRGSLKEAEKKLEDAVHGIIEESQK